MLEQLLLGHVFRHLAEDIVVIPRVKESHFFAESFERSAHKLGGDDLAEVADVHGAGGRDARGDGVLFLVAFDRDDFLRDLVCPVDGVELQRFLGLLGGLFFLLLCRCHFHRFRLLLRLTIFL